MIYKENIARVWRLFIFNEVEKKKLERKGREREDHREKIKEKY